MSRFDQLAERFRFVAGCASAVDDLAGQVRHKVYCEELGWETLRRSRIERDVFDRRALQYVILHEDQPVACARLILDANEAHEDLPIEVVCRHTIDQDFSPQRQNRDRLTEVSRLAIVEHMRRRKTDDSQAEIEDARFPFLPAALYIGLMAITSEIGTPHVYLLCERSLLVVLARIGLQVHPIGGPVEHRGKRIPCCIDTGISDGLKPDFKEFRTWIGARLADQIQALRLESQWIRDTMVARKAEPTLLASVAA